MGNNSDIRLVVTPSISLRSLLTWPTYKSPVISRLISGFIYSCLGSIPKGANGFVVYLLISGYLDTTLRLHWHLTTRKGTKAKIFHFHFLYQFTSPSHPTRLSSKFLQCNELMKHISTLQKWRIWSIIDGDYIAWNWDLLKVEILMFRTLNGLYRAVGLIQRLTKRLNYRDWRKLNLRARNIKIFNFQHFNFSWWS